MTDERPLKITDAYLPSTMSATSGLGSNYTTNTSGSGSTQLFTPSPRRKASPTSFSDVNEVPETEFDIDAPSHGRAHANYSEFRSPPTEHYRSYHVSPMHRTQMYTANVAASIDEALLHRETSGYFGECFVSSQCNLLHFRKHWKKFTKLHR